MSLLSARRYFRARLAGVGLKEWADSFNTSNIPANIIDKSFHISQGQVDGVKLNQHVQEMTSSIEIKVYLKGFKDTSSGLENSIKMSEDLIKESVAPRNRLTQSDGLKNVTFESVTFNALEDSNDNIIVTNLKFKVLTILGL